jgi:hypothetical protein
MGVVEFGTASSQPSSCWERAWPLARYHEPAWLGLRVTILWMNVWSMECWWWSRGSYWRGRVPVSCDRCNYLPYSPAVVSDHNSQTYLYDEAGMALRFSRLPHAVHVSSFTRYMR